MDVDVIRPEHVVVLRELLANPTMTKAELAGASGWARNTVSQRLAELIDAGWVSEAEDAAQRGLGRPSSLYRFREGRALTFVAEFGQDQLHATLVTLRGRVLAATTVPIDLGGGPDAAARTAADVLARTLDDGRIRRDDVAVAVVGVASPVDERHRAINPISAPGWFGADLDATFSSVLDLPVLAENDANLMAVGAARRSAADGVVVFVKVALGIGAGTVVSGRLQRGLLGLAGELGHTPVSRAAGLPCTCGNTGCLNRIAAVEPLVGAARDAGLEIGGFDDFERLAAEADPTVLGLIRQAGRDIGEALVGVATVLAPERVVLGGRLALIGEHLAAGVREALYTRVLPDLTRSLVIESSTDHHRDAVLGAAALAQTWVLDHAARSRGAVDR
uniref:ROK family transcriptional regulator n=1 Tax=Neobacillus citreus TaxID=2833578 RepID=A0A942Y9I6_9BACI